MILHEYVVHCLVIVDIFWVDLGTLRGHPGPLWEICHRQKYHPPPNTFPAPSCASLFYKKTTHNNYESFKELTCLELASGEAPDVDVQAAANPAEPDLAASSKFECWTVFIDEAKRASVGSHRRSKETRKQMRFYQIPMSCFSKILIPYSSFQELIRRISRIPGTRFFFLLLFLFCVFPSSRVSKK